MNKIINKINKKYKIEEEIFDLKLYIQNFVYSNWKYKDYVTKIEDIIIYLEEDDDEEYINDKEIFYKGILYI